MNQLEDLAALDLISLSETLASQRPATSDLSGGEWLGVVELLTGGRGRAGGSDRLAGADHQERGRSCSRARVVGI